MQPTEQHSSQSYGRLAWLARLWPPRADRTTSSRPAPPERAAASYPALCARLVVYLGRAPAAAARRRGLDCSRLCLRASSRRGEGWGGWGMVGLDDASEQQRLIFYRTHGTHGVQEDESFTAERLTEW